MKKTKWLSEEALQIAEKRREAKRQWKKDKTYPTDCRVQENSKDKKKAFQSEQCREIEEKNIIRKTRDLFKKIRDIKGTFHAKMGSIQDRNSKDLTEVEDMKKRWQEYIE